MLFGEGMLALAKQIILEWLLKDPCLGYRRLTTHVSNALQYQVNRKYVRRLMKELGLKAIYCKRNTSKPHPQHEKVPYLLKGVQIDKPDMVWATDITYLKVEGRTYYLCVVIDWASREALGYSVGRNMTVELCHESLTMALASDCIHPLATRHLKNGEKSISPSHAPPAKFFCDFSATAGLPPLRSGVALRATCPRLRYKIAKKLGLTINAKNSNLTTAPSIGSKIP